MNNSKFATLKAGDHRTVKLKLKFNNTNAGNNKASLQTRNNETQNTSSIMASTNSDMLHIVNASKLKTRCSLKAHMKGLMTDQSGEVSIPASRQSE